VDNQCWKLHRLVSEFVFHNREKEKKKKEKKEEKKNTIK